jgi:hypothetical protein
MARYLVGLTGLKGGLMINIYMGKLHYWFLTFTQVAHLVPNVSKRCTIGLSVSLR